MSRNFVLILLLAYILQSCDPGYNAEIINKSGGQIEVIFEYDEKIIARNIERNISFIPEVIYNNEDTRISFEIDTTKFIVTSLVKASDTLALEMGIGTHPDFKNIKMIRIYGSDTILLNNKEKMTEAFNESKKHQYQLIIK